jgi:hypothetical protein
MILAALALAAAQAEPPEIVVSGARRGRFRLQLAERAIGDRQLARHAREWAALGTPVRVRRPAGASYRCLARLVLRLNEHGVRLVHFIDPPLPAPAQ